MKADSTMKTIRSFTGLIAWQKGHELVLVIYRLTTSFPSRETYALIDQLRRAVVSITNNLAEGFTRQSRKEKLQFYSMALGSLTEVQNLLLVARDIGYLDREKFQQVARLTVEVSKLIHGLKKYLKNA